MVRQFRLGRLVPTLAALGLLATTACAPAAPASPTVAPAKPAAAPTSAPAAPTTAPAKPTAAPGTALAATPAPAASAAPAAPKPTNAPAQAAPMEELTDAERASVEQFYKGKTFDIIVGFAAGGGYDTYARLLSRYIGKYIPGNPTVIVENKTGAGSLVAANTVYNSGPKDGTQMVVFDEYLVLHQMAGDPAVEFDAAKFQWVGNPASDNAACAIRSDVGFNTFQDLVKSGKEVIIGATGKGSQPYATAAAIKYTTGANFKIITGYDGTSKIRLAVENKEVDGACWGWSSVSTTAEQWFQGNPPFAKVLIQDGLKRDPDLKDAPLVRELATDPTKAKILDVTAAAGDYTRPFTLPPGVPPERVKAIRLAFIKAFNDPEAQAEANKSKLQLKPNDFRVVTKDVETILAIPKDQAATFADVLGLK